ncbi:MAG TPA: GTP cyclohydrolase I FolE [Candidatus Paceibacterota bacterium]|nr:GTP cyclohydrolase I FolE [Candidatus Paceibacterota bacterium]
MQPNIENIAKHYRAILEELGVDLSTEGLLDTPKRAAKAIVEMTEGSRMQTDKLLTKFKTECEKTSCHDIIVVEGVHEVGLCEHHLLPIVMDITIAYVPGENILGLSKLSRIAGFFARRLQNQERTAHLIADFIEDAVQPLGVAVLIDGKHLCAAARGARDTHSQMKVDVVRGKFQSDSDLRHEFFMRLKNK